MPGKHTILVFNANRRHRVGGTIVRRYVARVLGKRRAQISVVFVDSHRCKAINRKYLNHNVVTDVISFPLEATPVLEGEIYVNLDRARQQAREFGVSYAHEVARLVIHGTLHLLGDDDTTPGQRKAMKEREDRQLEFWFTRHRSRSGPGEKRD